ncbi:hypothetical protein OIU77_018786 [Salix suchowensis]|uniref:Uncharacterized protein n=1 Tax=Salix suchowensis TaxID=1278906 RepID=A0ABQ9CH45_9ROSI|nr:hypothetical protein OIU77_018786 [Salix suchowensis]
MSEPDKHKIWQLLPLPLLTSRFQGAQPRTS